MPHLHVGAAAAARPEDTGTPRPGPPDWMLRAHPPDGARRRPEGTGSAGGSRDPHAGTATETHDRADCVHIDPEGVEDSTPPAARDRPTRKTRGGSEEEEEEEEDEEDDTLATGAPPRAGVTADPRERRSSLSKRGCCWRPARRRPTRTAPSTP